MHRLPIVMMFALAIIGFVFTAAMAPFSVMAFDGPGSTEQWEPWAVAIGMMSMPVILFAMTVAGAWLAWTGWMRTAALTLFAPATLGVAAVTLWVKLAML
jgi:hypothetical protein